jgi:large subunit ribosomal protein L6
MSRIGKLPISLPDKVEVKISAKKVDVKGPKGSLNAILPELVDVSLSGRDIEVSRKNDDREARSLHGLWRSLLSNMVVGVSQGFTKDLEITGVGYKAEVKGKELHLALGFSHPVIFPLPAGVSAEVDAKKVKISLASIDKKLLGDTAAKIRKYRPPEPYRGKGIKYAGETIRRKEGKSAGK